MIKAKPFIKWVGGKSQLIEQLDALLPADFGNWDNADNILEHKDSKGLYQEESSTCHVL